MNIEFEGHINKHYFILVPNAGNVDVGVSGNTLDDVMTVVRGCAISRIKNLFNNIWSDKHLN